MTRRIILAVALSLWIGFAGPEVAASCPASRPITSAGANGYTYVMAPDGAHVSPQVEGWFWALGRGDPAFGAGIDSGSLAAPHFFYMYMGLPWWVDTNWNEPNTDGCIDSATSGGPACVALALVDEDPSCDPYDLHHPSCTSLAVVTRRVASGAPIDFSLRGGQSIELARLPVVMHPEDWDDEPLPGTQVVVPAPTAGFHLDNSCPAPLVGYRVYIRREFLPQPFELAHGGAGPDGEPLPFGTSADIRFGCTQSFTRAILAYSIVFADGFETRTLSPLQDTDGIRGTQCCVDADVDAWCVAWAFDFEDCDDANPSVRPYAPQVCGDGLNNDCTHPAWPVVTDESDDDGDGFTECQGDCEDGAPAIFPGAGLAEVCDGFDNDCDGRSDEAPEFFGRVAAPAGSATHFGVSVASLGDVEGDGVGDFAVGARWDPVAGFARAGSVTVFSGASRAALGKLVHPAPGQEDEFGRSVASIDDVDGDGIDDLVVGAPLDDVSGIANAGSAHVFSGDAVAGFPLLESLVDPSPSTGAEFGYSVERLADVDGDLVGDVVIGARGDGGKGSASVFSGATASRLRKLFDPGGGAGDLFGYAVGGIEDLDGDGIAEVLVGAHLADLPAAADAGKVTIFGGASGAIVRTLTDPAPTAGEEFGRSLAAIEDVDGDGVEDLLIGAPEAGGTGQVLVFSGASGAFVDRVADPDGQAGDGFGYRVEASGDLDGDGVGDALVGAFRDDVGAAANAGSATVLSMRSRAVIAKLGDPAGAAGDLFGIDVAALDDLDGDGRQELLIGAYQRDPPAGGDAGEALLFRGAAVEDLDGDRRGDRCDSDMDGDGVDNDADCAPRIRGITAVPSEVTDVRFTRFSMQPYHILRWNDPPNATEFDVFRGLIVGGLAGADCILHSYYDQALAIALNDTPAPGQGYFYLVRGRNVCGVGTLGAGAGGAERVPGSECRDSRVWIRGRRPGRS